MGVIGSETNDKGKKAKIPKLIKQLVWNKYIGEKNGKGMCQCCKSTEITQMSFQCGHIVSEFNGGTVTLNNLIPLCDSSPGEQTRGFFRSASL